MFDFITKSIQKLVGSKSDRDIKAVLPIVDQINEEFAKLNSLTDDELRARTHEIREQIDAALKRIDDEIADLRNQVDEQPNLDIDQKEALFNKIDKLEEERNEELEKVLMQVLPETFAIVKETARRWKENKQMVVTATDMDHRMAAKGDHIEINGDKATWKNQWMAAGNLITWDMLHYDVQLIGGIVLHQGKIAEMATGEGKTLVATLPAFLNALSRRGVHVVTVNDYLARRDSEWMAPLFQFHGITIDCIDRHRPNSEERRQAYKADITYGTNNEFGFDYLRDNMARSPQDLVQRKHHYAMVDEVDSVLVDEARTPLIISGPVPKGNEHEFYELKPRVSQLVDAQRKLATQLLQDAKKGLAANPKDEDSGLALFRTYRAMPKYKPLIKYLSEPGVRQILQKVENIYLADNQKMMPEADKELYFTIDEKHNSIELTEKGIDLITKSGEDPSFFILPDIGSEIARLEHAEDLTDEQKLEQKDAMTKDYAAKSQRIHTVNQLLKAYTLFEKDTEYIIQDSKVKIVDEQTGRVMDGRRYSDGLHQAIEAKENVKIEDATQTYATITLQNYFRMYHKLAGMTGTAETEAGEFWEIYKLDVVVIPTNRPIQRDDRQDLVYKTMREKFNAVGEEIIKLREAGRPVLVGTTSVEISEVLSRMLKIRNIPHQVLNAKQHQREAEVVAEAGKPGTVTIATNMAGRGTDIKLAPESKAAGGLAIIGTERHDSRRVDRQLRGRAGRQGDPGSSQFFVSLEDSLMRLFGSDRIARLMDRMGYEEGEVIQHSMITKSIERAQKKVEENNFATRKRLLEYDDVMNSQREVIYKRRKHALFGERLQLDIMNMIYQVGEEITLGAKGANDFDSFKLGILGTFGFDYPITEEEFAKARENELVDQVYDKVYEHYQKKNARISEQACPVIKQVHAERGATVKNIVVPFTDGKKQVAVESNLEKNVATDCKILPESMEKTIALATIDMLWKDHLRDMDELKQGSQLASYEQKDPLLIYKFEAFEQFKRFISRLNDDTISFLAKADLPKQDPQMVQEARMRQAQQQQRLKESKEEAGSAAGQGVAAPPQASRPPVKHEPVKSQKVAGRNERVDVRYSDGSVKKNVKFKSVEQDIQENRCVIINQD
jgi:preprotein translocase subunit SecA